MFLIHCMNLIYSIHFVRLCKCSVEGGYIVEQTVRNDESMLIIFNHPHIYNNVS